MSDENSTTGKVPNLPPDTGLDIGAVPVSIDLDPAPARQSLHEAGRRLGESFAAMGAAFGPGPGEALMRAAAEQRQRQRDIQSMVLVGASEDDVETMLKLIEAAEQSNGLVSIAAIASALHTVTNDRRAARWKVEIVEGYRRWAWWILATLIFCCGIAFIAGYVVGALR